MTTPCIPALAAGDLDHDRLRQEMPDGRCPICDLTVPPADYLRIVLKVTTDPAFKYEVLKKKDADQGN